MGMAVDAISIFFVIVLEEFEILLAENVLYLSFYFWLDAIFKDTKIRCFVFGLLDASFVDLGMSSSQRS